ncbi:MAG TPA: PDZ domain-containing protein [Verrucomicrobiota bacterium]|nr:PDZ domain-containing protein [Verrucomicrobiota bacterium]
MKPALVRIRVVWTEFYEGREIKMQAVGSGAIITKEGHLVTNHHVAGHAVRMFCTLWDRDEIEAELVGTDPLTDISVLKLKPSSPREFVPAEFGDSSQLRVGDSVLAMGSPMALSQSVTLGIISNIEMIMPKLFGPYAKFKLDGEDVGSLVKWIGHDAPIYGGNSGGPLVNLKGEIIGINEISFGLGGAIPGNLARSVAEQIIAMGRVTRSWLGINVQPLFKHTTGKSGVLISDVVEDSPAGKAGLKSGDILLKLGGAHTDVRFDEQMPEFMQLASNLSIGKDVEAVVKRGDQELTLRLTPIERGEIHPKQQELKQWGLTARNISFLAAMEMKRETTNGVLVTSVRPGGPAGETKPPLAARDVIVEINSTPVNSIQDLLEITHKLTDGQTDPVPAIVTFERKADRYLAVVKIGIQELKDPGLEVTKSWLPIEAQVISREIARQLDKPTLKGFYITRVYADSTASGAGLKSGDFIIAVDGEKLTASGQEHADELSSLIRHYDVGSMVDLTVLRDETELKIPVETSRSPRLQREMKKYRNEEFEFTARDVSFFDTASQQWSSSQRGALVEEVRSGSWAELGSLYSGDLILQVNGQTIENVETLRHTMEQLAEKKQDVVLMKVLRGIRAVFLEFEPDWKH